MLPHSFCWHAIRRPRQHLIGVVLPPRLRQECRQRTMASLWATSPLLKSPRIAGRLNRHLSGRFTYTPTIRCTDTATKSLRWDALPGQRPVAGWVVAPGTDFWGDTAVQSENPEAPGIQWAHGRLRIGKVDVNDGIGDDLTVMAITPEKASGELGVGTGGLRSSWISTRDRSFPARRATSVRYDWANAIPSVPVHIQTQLYAEVRGLSGNKHSMTPTIRRATLADAPALATHSQRARFATHSARTTGPRTSRFTSPPLTGRRSRRARLRIRP